MHKYIIDQITGKFGSGVGEFWFKFIGYVLIVSLFHAANDLSSSLVIAATKWMSYLALYLWLKYEVEKAFYYVWPNLELRHGVERQNRAKDWQYIVANGLALMIVVFILGIGLKLSEVILELKP